MIAALRDRMQALDQVDVIAPARFDSLTYEDSGHVTLTLEAGEPVRARLVIGADGQNSKVRGALKIGARVEDYQQSAIITVVAPERAHAGCAYERFLPGGPLAILPRTPDTCAAVWAVPTDEATRLCQASETDFTRELNAAFGHRLGTLALAGPRGAYPLARVLADHAVADRAALIGNAGHALHPAAAQGFNLSIRDALGLADIVREHQALRGADFDPGDADMLAAWAEARRPDQHRVANFTDGIVRLFSSRLPGLGHARGAGLFGLSLAPGLRADMARRSMGLALLDDLPGRDARCNKDTQ